jgi:AmmeMemoRadiSam system protein A
MSVDVEQTDLASLARRAVETFVLEAHRVVEPPRDDDSSLLSQRSACFVCIKTEGRELRGCVGTIEPEHDSLAAEVVDNAIKAATRDPRFRPVSADELSLLRYSVDVLGGLEPTTLEDLDPSVFGVVVTNDSGTRRGLLLPNIDGIRTASQQVGVAARKAGIGRTRPSNYSAFARAAFRSRRKPHSLHKEAEQMADDKETKSSLGERQEDHELIPGRRAESYRGLEPRERRALARHRRVGTVRARRPLQRTRRDEAATHRPRRTGGLGTVGRRGLIGQSHFPKIQTGRVSCI